MTDYTTTALAKELRAEFDLDALEQIACAMDVRTMTLTDHRNEERSNYEGGAELRQFLETTRDDVELHVNAANALNAFVEAMRNDQR